MSLNETHWNITAFDVRSRALSVLPLPKLWAGPVFIPVGDDRLFLLSKVSFQVLNDVQSSSPFWEELPVPTLEADHYLASYAVHPDGRTIFVSVKPTRVGHDVTTTPATYAFDTAAGWTKQGDWALPFNGLAHYDADLDAWVGLAGDAHLECFRHICACDVVTPSSAGGGGEQQPCCPSWKMLRDAETPFSVDPNEEHVGACLVYCRGGRRRGEFCLVQTAVCRRRRAGEAVLLGRHKWKLQDPGGNKKETSKQGMMPTKRRSGERGDGGRTRRQQHLYLLVDDWAWGYSVRKIDLPIAADSESDPGSEQAVARLPRAVFRFEARHGKLQMAAVGTAIVAVPHNKATHGNDPPRPLQIGQVTAFDVLSRGLAVLPLHAKFRSGPPVLIPAAGDRLFLLSCRGDSFQARHCFASSATVHPDGRTIFVTANKALDPATTISATTYAFDTRAAGWTKRGDWALPFTGRAHYDADLDAWVGLAGDTSNNMRICASDVVSSSEEDGGGRQCPSWKAVSKEEALFSAEPDEEHVGACLVPMVGSGRRSEFCLVESVDYDVAGRSLSCYHPGPINERVKLRLVTFSLRYDKNGDLTTGDTRRVRYYRAPDAVGYSLLHPEAFWL
ncbi:hypothetical protein EJB05_04498, partial [Eragrostis curvula]